VPIITRRPCSTKIGHANAKRFARVTDEDDGDCGSLVELEPLMTARPDLSEYQSAQDNDNEQTAGRNLKPRLQWTGHGEVIR
jgi:hypothetical protein